MAGAVGDGAKGPGVYNYRLITTCIEKGKWVFSTRGPTALLRPPIWVLCTFYLLICFHFLLGVVSPPPLTCLIVCSPVGGALLEDCGTFHMCLCVHVDVY